MYMYLGRTLYIYMYAYMIIFHTHTHTCTLLFSHTHTCSHIHHPSLQFSHLILPYLLPSLSLHHRSSAAVQAADLRTQGSDSAAESTCAQYIQYQIAKAGTKEGKGEREVLYSSLQEKVCVTIRSVSQSFATHTHVHSRALTCLHKLYWARYS